MKTLLNKLKQRSKKRHQSKTNDDDLSKNQNTSVNISNDNQNTHKNQNDIDSNSNVFKDGISTQKSLEDISDNNAKQTSIDLSEDSFSATQPKPKLTESSTTSFSVKDTKERKNVSFGERVVSTDDGFSATVGKNTASLIDNTTTGSTNDIDKRSSNEVTALNENVISETPTKSKINDSPNKIIYIIIGIVLLILIIIVIVIIVKSIPKKNEGKTYTQDAVTNQEIVKENTTVVDKDKSKYRIRDLFYIWIEPLPKVVLKANTSFRSDITVSREAIVLQQEIANSSANIEKTRALSSNIFDSLHTFYLKSRKFVIACYKLEYKNTSPGYVILNICLTYFFTALAIIYILFIIHTYCCLAYGLKKISLKEIGIVLCLIGMIVGLNFLYKYI